MTLFDYLTNHFGDALCLIVALGVVVAVIISAIRGETPW